MSVTIMSRNRGAVIRCNNCSCTITTGQVEANLIRTYAETQGWRRGMVKGTRGRPAVPAVAKAPGVRARKARPEVIGTASTLRHDLCPPLRQAGPSQGEGAQDAA